jgi:hypothetical protein
LVLTFYALVIQTGKYGIVKCEPFAGLTAISGNSFPCSVVSDGSLTASIGASSILSFGNFTLALFPKRAKIAVFRMRDDSPPVENAYNENMFFDLPEAEFSVPNMANNKLISIGNGQAFELNKQTGEYRVWLLDPQRSESPIRNFFCSFVGESV